MVDGVHLVIHIGDKQILPAVLVIVGGIDAHAGAGATILTISDPGPEAGFFELAFTIEKKKIGNSVIGHEEIHPVVVIDISRDRSPGFPVSLTDAGFLRDITERAVAVVMKQVARHRLRDSGKAVVAFAGTSVAAKFVL